MEHDDTTCAALPVTVLSVTLVGCHAHQAVQVRAHAYTQQGDDLSTWWESSTVELGPFDGLAELHDAWSVAAARSGARLPDLLRRLRS